MTAQTMSFRYELACEVHSEKCIVSLLFYMAQLYTIFQTKYFT